MIQGVNNNTYSYSTQGPVQDNPVQDLINQLEEQAAPLSLDQEEILKQIEAKLGDAVLNKTVQDLMMYSGKLDPTLASTLTKNGIDADKLQTDTTNLISIEDEIAQLEGRPLPPNSFNGGLNSILLQAIQNQQSTNS